MFKEALEAIVQKTDGSLGALIMGTDGLSVETCFSKEGAEANLDVAAAEFTSVVRRAIKSGADLDLGKLREMVVKFRHTVFQPRLLRVTRVNARRKCRPRPLRIEKS